MRLLMSVLRNLTYRTEIKFHASPDIRSLDNNILIIEVYTAFDRSRSNVVVRNSIGTGKRKMHSKHLAGKHCISPIK